MNKELSKWFPGRSKQQLQNLRATIKRGHMTFDSALGPG